MGWFSRKKQKDAEQAVIVHYNLSDDEYGLAEEREAVFRLEDRLESLIERNKVGEFDDPDADRQFDVIEQELRSFTARPAYAILRYGEAADPSSTESHVDL